MLWNWTKANDILSQDGQWFSNQVGHPFKLNKTNDIFNKNGQWYSNQMGYPMLANKPSHVGR